MEKDSNCSQVKELKKLYSKIQDYENIIRECEDVILKKKNEEKTLDVLMIDLIKENKIRWETMSFEQWYISDIKYFWIYSTDDEIKMGVFHGIDSLNKKELSHFDHFKEDYFYYGYPLYYNVNKKKKNTEREEAFLNGAKLSCINRDEL